ncbi:MAG TPA: hypothetical protein VGR11_14755 [Solirubrobacteraceae bacterium]|nr:hypothetical protein [Solirubrobacteraceae bacterium]
MRSIKIAAAAAGCMLALGGSAGAAGKHRVVVDRVNEPYEFTIDCSDFGPYSFDNIVSGHERTRVTEVRTADGTLLQTVVHTSFSETDTNSESGASLGLKGAYHEVLDYRANTRTISGKVALGTQPGGGGTYIQEVGRIVMALDTYEPLFVAGPHDAFFAGGIDVPVCAALADA